MTTITFTPGAAAQIKQSVEKFGGVGLRLGVKRVGCNGLQYTYDMAKEIGPADLLVEAHDAKLVVNGDAVAYLDGSQLDYVNEGFKRMFTVTNPNVKSTCGCGESFNVD
jgi:iron-sulfur cluster assembly protein